MNTNHLPSTHPADEPHPARGAVRVAVLGATGLVGETLLRVLEERRFPVAALRPLASERSRGRTVRFAGEDHPVEAVTADSFDGIDLVLASAGGDASRRWLPEAAKRGAVSVDNTSAFRMEPDVPLVVPEVNGARALEHGPRRIVANPNCSTIQLVVALAPLHARFGVRRVHVATYQSVSGAGRRALEELRAQTGRVLQGEPATAAGATATLAFNAVPRIDVPLADGDTREEWKMRVETPKILEAAIPVHATCVRVPSFVSHAEAVWIETTEAVSPEAARETLAAASGIEVVDDLAGDIFPTPVGVAGSDAVQVGRIRRDPSTVNGLAFWIVADNMRKGAATNAVQIAEILAAHWRREGRS